MTTALPIPKHVTRPFGARTITASHPHLDMSAWIMSTGKEVLVFKGQIVDSGGERARDAVFAYRRGTLQRTCALILALYKINLDPRVT